MLPASVKARVLQDIASSNNVPIELLTVVGARAKSWPDGCLGLGGPNNICTFAIVDAGKLPLAGQKSSGYIALTATAPRLN